jgi:hypothetical protein
MALTKVTKELIQGSLSVEWQSAIKTSSFQSITGQGYFVNTTASAVTVTMPATASVGDIVSIVDYAGTAQTNNITITAALNINGSSNNVKINYERGAVSIIYSGTAEGWVAEVAANDGTDALVNIIPAFSANYLIVAGGGGGGGNRQNGNQNAGGGGAGGYLTNYGGTSLTLSPATNYTITVGVGGAGGISDTTLATNGSNSTFSPVSTVAYGGGAGAGQQAGGNPGNGGSGGGGAVDKPTGGTANPTGQGNDGGTSNGYSVPGGGGGGAGAVGGGGSVGTGGIGLTNAITVASGTGPYYAGGGGGSYASGSQAGGAGGGGAGSSGGNGTNGTDGFGGGGGGAYGNGGSNGGSGGDGVIILRYPSSVILTNPGGGLSFTTDSTTVSGTLITTFTSVGTGTIIFS